MIKLIIIWLLILTLWLGLTTTTVKKHHKVLKMITKANLLIAEVLAEIGRAYVGTKRNKRNTYRIPDVSGSSDVRHHTVRYKGVL